MKKIKKLTKKKLIIMTIVTLLLSGVLEFILVESNVHEKVEFGIAIYHFALIWFVALNFTAGFKKLYEYIIDNRFIFSGVMIILSTIVGYLINYSSMNNFLEWIIKTDIPLNLIWNIEFFGFLLVGFEVFRIVTDKNDMMSVVGAVVITMSSAVQYNMGKSIAILMGLLIFVLFTKIISDKNRTKINNIILHLGYVLSIVGYGICYGPYVKSFIYLLLALVIWQLIKNKKDIKSRIKDYIILAVSTIIGIILSVAGVLILKYNYDLITLNYNGISFLMSYIYGVLLPFYNIEHKELLASYISIFPIPMLLALYYMYKNEKHIEFLFPVTIVSVFGTLFCSSILQTVLQGTILFNNVSNVDLLPVTQIANILLIFYFCGNIKEELFNVKVSMRLTIVIICMLLFLTYPKQISTKLISNIYILELCMLSFLFLNFGDKKYRKVLLFFLVFFTLMAGIPVNFII